MQSIFDFVWNNWAIIVPVLVAVISEVMALNPTWKGNGVLDLIKKLLVKK